MSAALAAVRKAKSEAKVGMRTEVTAMTIAAPEGVLAQIRSAEPDLRAAGRVTGEITYAESPELIIRDVHLEMAAAST